ncbi:nuclease homologue [Gemmobacter aquatilis]|uniref:Nuclease homologue n=1 Tax=Gemmobacter aquatilis TaxID=933059 RepID=A0A1H8KQ88_9RHOB|nr:thermonuclease family protein [Gemmobacter aquatilis]SEN94776.1 nuclease homologue [Gemmobacter aquatilis]
MTCTLALCLTAALTVTDGDTIRDGALRIRLWGIDAPELQDPRGPASRAYLRALIDGQPVACDPRNADRYGRTVATCHLPDGRDLACEMVRAGMAHDWPRYSKGAYARCEGE